MMEPGISSDCAYTYLRKIFEFNCFGVSVTLTLVKDSFFFGDYWGEWLPSITSIESIDNHVFVQ